MTTATATMTSTTNFTMNPTMNSTMSSTDVMSVPGRLPRSTRRSAQVYRRRRVAFAGSALGVVALASMVATGLLAGPGGVPASASGTWPAAEVSVVVARSGDTLWSIAHEHRGAVSHARYVDALVRLNGGAAIQAGQAVVLP
jgi:nucleoid-associated protein YgaU